MLDFNDVNNHSKIQTFANNLINKANKNIQIQAI